jgi:hypothetical protein
LPPSIWLDAQILLNLIEGAGADVDEFRRSAHRTMDQLLNVENVANPRVGVALMPLIPAYRGGEGCGKP